jgi:hypothetical protein
LLEVQLGIDADLPTQQSTITSLASFEHAISAGSISVAMISLERPSLRLEDASAAPLWEDAFL